MSKKYRINDDIEKMTKAEKVLLVETVWDIPLRWEHEEVIFEENSLTVHTRNTLNKDQVRSFTFNILEDGSIVLNKDK